MCLCVLCMCAGVPCKRGNVDPVSISYPVRMVGMGQVGLDVGWEQVVTGARAGVGELFLRERVTIRRKCDKVTEHSKLIFDTFGPVAVHLQKNELL